MTTSVQIRLPNPFRADCRRAFFAGVLGGFAAILPDFQFAIAQAIRSAERWPSALAACAVALTLSTFLAVVFSLLGILAMHLVMVAQPGLPLPLRFKTPNEYRLPFLSALTALLGFSASLLFVIRLLAPIPTPMVRLIYLSLATFALACVWLVASFYIYAIVRRTGGLFRLVVAFLLLLLLVTWWVWGLLMIRFVIAAEVMLVVALTAYFRPRWRIWRLRFGVLPLSILAAASLPWSLEDPAFELVYLSRSLPSYVLRFLPAHNRSPAVLQIRSAIADRVAHPVTRSDPTVPQDTQRPSVASTHPNILLITIDTLRADRIGARSGAVSLTPNLDRLAASSLNFRRAYAAAPATVESMSQLMTGVLWHEIPHLPAFLGATAQIAPGTSTLASRLGELGYSTVAVIQQDVLAYYPSLALGFNRVMTRDTKTSQDLDTTTLFDKTVELQNSEGGRPLFVWTHCMEVHGHATRHGVNIVHYDESVRRVDEAIGKFLAAVASGPRWQNTVLILAADHGEGLGEGGVFYHAIARAPVLSIPLIVRIPGTPPRDVYTVVGTHDIHATILAQAGLGRSSRYGKDLLLIADEPEDRNRIVYHSYVVATAPQQVYELGATRYPWQLIYEFRDDFRMLRNIERDPGGSVNLAGRGLAVEGELLQATLNSLSP